MSGRELPPDDEMPSTLGGRLAEAVLLFHRGGQWRREDQARWTLLTGEAEATTRALCDFARAVQGEVEGGE